MKVVIIYKYPSKTKGCKEVEFNGTNAMAEGMQFVYNNQPITVVAVRITENKS